MAEREGLSANGEKSPELVLSLTFSPCLFQMYVPNVVGRNMGIRSGDHIRWRGGVAHYRRVVPENCRAAFGRVEVTKSLEVRSEGEARRLEKALDVEFDSRVSAIRHAKDPHRVATQMTTAMRLTDGSKTVEGAEYHRAVAAI